MSSHKSITEYQAALTQIALVARVLLQHDIQAMVAAIDTADAVGPLFDPSLWIRNNKAMGEDREMLEAALPLWRWVKSIEARAAPTSEPVVL